MSIYIFQQQVSTAATELVAQDVEKFNAASNGTILLGSQSHIGDYVEETSWKLIGNLAIRRNAYDKTGTLTPKELDQVLDRMVKVDGTIGPITVTPAMMERLGKNVAEASAVVAAQAARAMLADYLNVGITAASAAFQLKAAGAAGSVWTEIAAGANLTTGQRENPTLQRLVGATKPFGDAQSSIRAFVMNGASYNDFLVNDVLKNAAQLFTFDGVQVLDDGFGRRFIITDADGLADGQILGLTQGGIIVQTAPLAMYSDTQLGGVNVKNLLQGEYNFHVGLKGYALADKVATQIARTASITPAQLADKASWQQSATDIKDTAGVLLTFAVK